MIGKCRPCGRGSGIPMALPTGKCLPALWCWLPWRTPSHLPDTSAQLGRVGTNRRRKRAEAEAGERRSEIAQVDQSRSINDTLLVRKDGKAHVRGSGGRQMVE